MYCTGYNLASVLVEWLFLDFILLSLLNWRCRFEVMTWCLNEMNDFTGMPAVTQCADLEC